MKKRIIMAVCLLSVFGAQAQIISTVAGKDLSGFSGDGAQATNATLSDPSGVAVDGAGNMYIADEINNRIRKVNASGIISTFAGGGTSGIGDGGQATDAELNTPEGVAVDGAGNVYIADFYFNRIRKVNTAGVITTVAGSLGSGYMGDGAQATLALLNHPAGIAVDASGNLYIADMMNNCIRKVSASGIISTIAGNGTPGFSGDGFPATSATLKSPTSVAVDGAGNVYIADEINNRIRKVNASGIISTFAGNGTPGFGGDGTPATSATLNSPSGVLADGYGSVYIADQDNNRIRKVNPFGAISTVAGNGTPGFGGDGAFATSAELNFPACVALDASGNMYIADQNNNRIRKIKNTSTEISSVAAQSGISIFPNPNNGNFTINGQLNSLLGESVSVDIVDMLGQVVYSEVLLSEKGDVHTTVSLCDRVSNGLYVLRIRSNADTETTIFSIAK